MEQNEVFFVDTTTRDGSQSNWAAGMPVGMMDAIMEDLDKVGYRSLCCPLMQLHMKKVIRDLKEDPGQWSGCLQKSSNTKRCYLTATPFPFDLLDFNREAIRLYDRLLVRYGALQGVQITGNVMEQ